MWGPECGGHSLTPVSVGLRLSLTLGPLEAVSKRLAVMENRIV